MYLKPTRRGIPTHSSLAVQCLNQDLTETSFSETDPLSEGQDEYSAHEYTSLSVSLSFNEILDLRVTPLSVVLIPRLQCF